METKYRKVELFLMDKWTTINFIELQKGDLFRMFDDPADNPVETGEPYVALGDSYLFNGVWSIECEKESEHDKSGIDSKVIG